MTTKIYTYKNCSTCKQATKWLDARGIDYDEHPIRETPPSKSELARMVKLLDGARKKVLNVAGRDYRSMGLKDRVDDMSDDELFDLLQENGNLVKRPFLLAGDVGLVGFKPEVWAEALE